MAEIPRRCEQGRCQTLARNWAVYEEHWRKVHLRPGRQLPPHLNLAAEMGLVTLQPNPPDQQQQVQQQPQAQGLQPLPPAPEQQGGQGGGQQHQGPQQPQAQGGQPAPGGGIPPVII
jgi:hypothetical protein